MGPNINSTSNSFRNFPVVPGIAVILKQIDVRGIPINRYMISTTDGLIRFDQFAKAEILLVYQTL